MRIEGRIEFNQEIVDDLARPIDKEAEDRCAEEEKSGLGVRIFIFFLALIVRECLIKEVYDGEESDCHQNRFNYEKDSTLNLQFFFHY
jgi:hypothetical protein